MARKDVVTKLSVNVVDEVGTDGKTKYLSRTISGVNPSLSDADAYSIANKFGNLQSRELGAIKRTDTAVLIED